MDMKIIDRIVINDHAVTVRIKQSRVDNKRIDAHDFLKIVKDVGHDTAVPAVRDTKNGKELWIRFERF